MKFLLTFTVDIEGSQEKFFDGDVTMVPSIVSLFTGKAPTFTNLQFLHATLPYMQGTLWDHDYVSGTSGDDCPNSEDDDEPDFHLPSCGITSMSLSMHDDEGIDFTWLGQLSNIIEETPTVRLLELRDWTQTDHPGLDGSLGEPGTWSVTHLSLLDCGRITEDMEHVLIMPRELQSLKITCEIISSSRRFYVFAEPISIQETVTTLESVQATLVELELDPGATEHWARPELFLGRNSHPKEPYQSHAFTSFSKLQRLEAPLEMFSQSTGKMTRDENHTFYTNFPPSLEKLTLVVTSRGPFHQALEGTYALPNDQVVLGDCIEDIDSLSCHASEYEKAHELFKELSQLADHRSLIPGLRELHLLRDPCQWLVCEHVRQCTLQLEQVGITVYVHDREIEGPTQSDYKRWVSEV
jgi:hypothetical protein